MISHEEALELVKSTSKFEHVMVVASIMAGVAERLGESVDKWWLVGLLHDLDFDETKSDRARHGIMAAERLSQHLPADCLYAIKAHDHRTGFPRVGSLDIALIAADSLAVLMQSAGKDSNEVTEEVLQNEMGGVLKEKPWLKVNILQCEKLGLSVAEFLKTGLGARPGTTNLAWRNS